jgi:DNA-binding transcriptional LysR family regulator
VEIRTFTAVVDAGSFIGVADELKMSKTQVSRHMNDLELRLGALLLHRITRRMSLTEKGDVFYARCVDILDGVKEAESEITSCECEVVGSLRIAVPVSFGILYLAKVWGKFTAFHPKITLDVTLTDRWSKTFRNANGVMCIIQGNRNYTRYQGSSQPSRGRY